MKRTLANIRNTFAFSMSNEERVKVAERISRILLKKSELFCNRQKRIIEQYKTKLRRTKDLVLTNELTIPGAGIWYMVCIISFDDNGDNKITTIGFQKFVNIQAKSLVDNGIGFYGVFCDNQKQLYNEFSPFFIQKFINNATEKLDMFAIVTKLAEYIKNNPAEYESIHSGDIDKFKIRNENGCGYGFCDEYKCHLYTTFVTNEQSIKASAVV